MGAIWRSPVSVTTRTSLSPASSTVSGCGVSVRPPRMIARMVDPSPSSLSSARRDRCVYEWTVGAQNAECQTPIATELHGDTGLEQCHEIQLAHVVSALAPPTLAQQPQRDVEVLLVVGGGISPRRRPVPRRCSGIGRGPRGASGRGS